MVPKEELISMLASNEITRRDKIMIILASADGRPLQTADIKKIAKDSGLREIEKWNVSDVLGRAKGLTAKVSNGWILTVQGQACVDQELLHHPLSTKAAAKSLRYLLPSIKNEESKAFVEEAIQCLETNAYRAAVVFSWIGAVSILYDYVLAHRLTDFNNEAKRHDAKWKVASTRDDLARMRESDFLDILGGLSILSKNVKEHLKNKAQL